MQSNVQDEIFSNHSCGGTVYHFSLSIFWDISTDGEANNMHLCPNAEDTCGSQSFPPSTSQPPTSLLESTTVPSAK